MFPETFWGQVIHCSCLAFVWWLTWWVSVELPKWHKEEDPDKARKKHEALMRRMWGKQYDNP